MRRFVHGLGARARGALIALGDVAALAWLGLRSLPDLAGPAFRVVSQVTVRQIFFTGNQALPLTGLIAFLIGAIVVIQAITRLPGLGVEAFAGDLLVVAVMRELGPVIAAVIVIGRSGTAIAAEMATMRLRGEVADLETMGIDPVPYLFLPRLVGTIVALFSLMIYFDLLAVAGGYAALGMQTTAPFSTFLGNVAHSLKGPDLALLPIKAILFGGMIAVFACHRGLSVEASPTEIPQAATRAVVLSLVGIFVADYVLAALVYA